MFADAAPVGSPLRQTDPTHMGPYRLLRRLGEGGMGTVFLADDPAGRRVAVKVIRAEHAADPDFRRRFRSEVAHAQTVPPFCTAEVLDADPNHDTPYLVVEYVEGPTLAEVVAARGPLSPANVYGVAVTVASALTAIHGAGVIHRDLKPSNVLLAPGAPKVIDFGIASAASSATVTGGEMVVGTVAYMSPERLESTAGDRPTAAADVFAWGAVVAFAANGRPPFLSGSPTATAIAILTREPDLGDLTEPLRSLVARALAKNPADRPTARGLYDDMVSTESRPATMIAASGASTTAARATEAIAAGSPAAEPIAAEPQAAGAITPESRVTEPRTIGAKERWAGATEIVVATPPAEVHPVAPAPAGRAFRRRRVAVGAATLLLVAVGGVVIGLITRGPIRSAGNAAAPQSAGITAPAPDTTASPSSSPRPSSPSSSLPPSGAPTPPAPLHYVYLRDPLTHEIAGRWLASADSGDGYNASCTFTRNGLRTEFSSIGLTRTWRCDSPHDLIRNVQVTVSVTLNTPGTCGAVWFRFQGRVAGYAMRVCTDRVEVGTHSGATLTVLRKAELTPSLTLGRPARFSVMVVGDVLTVLQCAPASSGCPEPQLLGHVEDSTFSAAGTVQLGLFEPDDVPAHQTYLVTFANIEIRSDRAAPSSP